jgi:hypothetical protein
VLSYDLRQKIVAQALSEIQFARTYKQGKTKNWKVNEDLYYGRKIAPDSSRANVDLGKMSAFVHTILSKIDNPMSFKFAKRKESQLQRVQKLNALRAIDQDKDNWDIKDLAAKKQAIIYNRAIMSYYADSIDGYKAHLDNVDVYDFLIDPSAGGLDIEQAMYLGDFGVIKTRSQLKQGVKDGLYLRTETNTLLDGSGNTTDMNQEETNKRNRTQDTQVWTTQKEIGNPDKYKFWRWGTTYDGQRYFLLLSERAGTAIEVCPIEEKFASGLWWYWSYAAFPDLTEFWAPGYCDYVREVFMAQAVSINQMLDNAEQINKPQKAVDVGAVKNLSQLKYRKDGFIELKTGTDVNKAIQIQATPSITTPINVYGLLEEIQEKASGVTAGTQGSAENNSGSKATIYQGNQENSADRFGLFNKSYAFGYKAFARLWLFGVKEHLVKKVSIDILGPEGVELFEVSRRDLFRKGESYTTMVEASNAELALSEQEKQTKIQFLREQAAIPVMPGQKPVQNAQKAYELQAAIVGFDDDTIRQLMDVSDFGDAELMAEAQMDIERILDGEIITPNSAATTAYKQEFVDYMQDNEDDISDEQFQALANYVLQLDPIIQRNMERHAQDVIFKQQLEAANQPIDPNAAPAPMTAPAPVSPMTAPTNPML